MSRLLRSVALAAATLGAGIPTARVLAAQPPTTAPAAATAERFVRALEHGAFAEAASLSALPAPAGGTTEQLLRNLWTQLSAQLGALTALGAAETRPEGAGHAVDLDGRFARAAVTLRVVLNATEQVTGFWVRPPRAEPWKAPAYVDTTRFDEHAVTVGAEPTLPGTLTMPTMRPEAGVPAVVLVHGSGPNDRDERLGPNRPFKDLAWGLASRGIAVLRYDKRSHAAPTSLTSGGPPTVEREVVLDALAALEVARRTPGVDPRRVVVLGHSLGGTLAPEIARRDGHVAGAALLAPGGARPWGELLAEQLAYIETLPNAAVGQRAALLPTLEQLDRRALAPETPVLGVPASYWYDLAERTPVEAARALPVPILAMFGGRDYQVPVADAAIWERALAGQRGKSLRRFPMLDHLFRVGEGMATPADYQTRGASVAPDVVQALATWILDLPARD